MISPEGQSWERHLKSCAVCHAAKPGDLDRLCIIGRRLANDFGDSMEVEAGTNVAPDAYVADDVTDRYRVPMFTGRRS